MESLDARGLRHGYFVTIAFGIFEQFSYLKPTLASPYVERRALQPWSV
jgi:hypothetical protein